MADAAKITSEPYRPGRRCGDDNFRAAGDLCRDSAHQHRRRQWGCSARHVNADAPDRRHTLSEYATQFGRRQSGNGLQFVEGAYAVGCQFKALEQVGRNAVACSVDEFGRKQPRSPTARRQFFRPVEQGRITALSYIVQNALYHFVAADVWSKLPRLRIVSRAWVAV